MKLMNLDMHISVIQDVEHILTNLGHEVVRNSLSGHNWVDGSRTSKLKVVTSKSWTKIDSGLVQRFYKRYKNEFAEFDGFIHSYPPSFALLFEPFDKPVITVTCTRFDFPAFPNNYQWLLQGLRRMSGNGQLVLTANNRLDKMYNERFLGIETTYISSLCDYLVQKSETVNNEFIFWSRYHKPPAIRGISREFSMLNRYDRNSIRGYSGVVHHPYNLSIMSAFEQYWQNIPLYFPSVEFQKQLFRSSEGSLEEVLFPKSALFFDETMIRLADWYDDSNFTGVRLFDSWDDLSQMLINDDLEAIRNNMAAANELRMRKIYASWDQLVKKL